VLLYYITGRKQFPGPESAQRQALLKKISEAVRLGVDFIQLREKDLSARELEILARDAVQVVRSAHSSTRLLINSRTDVGIAAGANGVHLRSNDLSPSLVRTIYDNVNLSAGSNPVIGVSCHSSQDVMQAAAEKASFAVLAPIFEKPGSDVHPAGLEMLAQACRQDIPVLALGGITVQNAAACVGAGAAGVAGIRLFQENDLQETIAALRNIA
jgi:thiamine-phosphate pyrophosphorylase